MSQSEGESFPEIGLHGLSCHGSFLKLCASSQLWSALTIHQMNDKFTIAKFQYFSTSFSSFCFFFSHKCHLCQLPRDSAFLISVSEITPSAFGISLWVDDLFFSPPGASIRRAGPGPEPKPGREPEPRRWHTDRQSDPLAGPGFCPGHRLVVQDTGQIEGHTEGERCVKVRHDSVTRAAFLFWHLMRERRRGRQEGGEAGQGQS